MFFGPKHSLVVPFDYLGTESLSEFEEQVLFLKNHYRLSKLSEIVERLKRGKSQGLAAIVLENPRKGLLIQAVPVLLSLEIPFTIFIDTEYVGLNRLPVEEELRAYQAQHPQKMTEELVHHWIQRAQVVPEEVDSFLKKCRSEIGPLPIESLDSFSFFTTWGKLIDLPSTLVEFGIKTLERLEDHQKWNEKISFFRNQLKLGPTSIRAPAHGFSEEEKRVLMSSGIQSVLGHQIGEVTRETDLFNLPIWKLT